VRLVPTVQQQQGTLTANAESTLLTTEATAEQQLFTLHVTTSPLHIQHAGQQNDIL